MIVGKIRTIAGGCLTTTTKYVKSVDHDRVKVISDNYMSKQLICAADGQMAVADR